jgi:hypothetical protein
VRKKYPPRSWAIAILLLTSTASVADKHRPPLLIAQAPTPALSGLENKSAVRQMLYVPAYSHIYYYNKQHRILLAITLSIRNTDLAHPITITSVRYYDTPGQLVKEYLEQPLPLRPLESTDFVVEERDTRGGIGANFIVEWMAEERVNDPIVEAVMISSGTQGISFVSPGRVIRGKNP